MASKRFLFLVQIIIMDNGRVQHQGSPYDIARADHDLEVKWKEAVRRASVTEDVRTAESSTEMERKSLRRQCSRKFSVVSHTDSVIGKLKPNTIFFTYTESPWEKAIEQLQMSYKLMDTSSPLPSPKSLAMDCSVYLLQCMGTISIEGLNVVAHIRCYSVFIIRKMVNYLATLMCVIIIYF